MSDMDIARDDLALDAIAAGHAPDGDDAALTMLFALREELEPPVKVASERADAPVAPVVPIRSRRRSAAAFVAAAAAGLVVGGVLTGAVAVADRPGEFLHTTHVAVLGADDSVAKEATSLLDQAAATLARGDRTGAKRLLQRATPVIDRVPDAGDRDALRQRHSTLVMYAAEAPSPSASPSPDDSDGRSESPEPRESDDDNSGSGSSGSGSDDPDGDSSGSGSGSDDSGGGSSGSGSGSDDSGSRSDSSGSGSGKSGSGSGSDHD